MKIIIFFLFITNFTFAQSKNIDTIQVKQDYEKLITNLKKNYVYYNSKDVNLICMQEYYSKKVGEVKSENEAILFFEQILNEFYDNHLHLNTACKSSYRLYSLIYAVTKGNLSTVSSTWKDQIENGKIINITNAEILTFNGINFNELIEAFPTHCQNKKNDEIRTWITNKILAGKRNEPRILVTKSLIGTIDTLNLDKIKIRKDSNLLSSSVIENIGIIRFNNSLGQRKTKKEFKKALKNLKETDGLILDLRNTIDGGNTNVANPIAGHFTNKKTIFQKYKNKTTEFVDYIKPKNPRFTKPLIVLVGRWTGSVGEGLASGFDGSGIAEVIGTEMAKLAGATKSYNFSNFNFGYQAPYIDVLHISGYPREKFKPKFHVRCNDTNEDEFIKEGIRIIKEKK